MPIYEFYCESCKTIFNFFSVKVNTETKPHCPKCKINLLKRKPALFATLKFKGEEEPLPEAFQNLDEDKLEKAVGSLASEFGDLENMPEDPKMMAKMMKRFTEVTGFKFGQRWEEMLHRLEKGEDVEKLEEEMEGMDEEDLMKEFFEVKKAIERKKFQNYKVDEELYFL
jgi:putative FmdB family regulatory protein